MQVLIVGAGISGMTLGALLEKGGVGYTILERAHEVKPLGSAMSVSASISAVFKQLGVWDEILSNSQPIVRGTSRYDPPRKPDSDDMTHWKERYGDYSYVLTRPKLYEILSKLVPKDKIHFGKRVLSIQQNNEGVMVRCQNGEFFHSDVLVGADGAYSAIRQCLYKQMKEKGLLPKEDDSSPPFNTLSLVGVTRPMPKGTFETLPGESRAEGMFYKGLPYHSGFFSLEDGSVAWLVLQHAGSFVTREEERFRNSEWGPEAAETMIEKVRDLPSPYGQPLSLYIDNTPREHISKVMLEEKLYKTWTYGRVVLLGDACHKFFPAAGQGAVSAIQDAVVLANVLEACPTPHIEDVRRCLNAYKDERFPQAKVVYNASRSFAEFFKQDFKGRFLGFLLKILPRNIMWAHLDKLYLYRPQVAFLPLIPDEGIVKGVPLTNYDHLRDSVVPV